MLKNRLLYAALLIGLIFFHAFYTGWISWFLLIFTLCLPLLSLLCSLPFLLSQQFSAQLPAQCLRGEERGIRLINQSATHMPALPCSFQLVCADRLAGSSDVQRYAFAAWNYRDIRLDTAHCGAYDLSFAKARLTDYLGLFSFRMNLPALGRIYVLPRKQQPEPLPNLSRFQARAFRPKPGGGFSEIHDMREYRPGDGMRDIHWKLSAKTDTLIVREALEPNRSQLLLTLDLRGSRAEIDRTLDILNWMSIWLLEHEAAHYVCWLQPETCEPETAAVASEEDIQKLMERLLSAALRGDLPSIAEKGFTSADWRYHIRLPETQKEGCT